MTTMPTGGRSLQQALAEMVPQTWWEWANTLYDPYETEWDFARFGKTLTVAGNATNIAADIQVPEPIYVFGVGSCGINTTANPVVRTGLYRISFKQQNGLEWFGGRWLAALITGDDAATTPAEWTLWKAAREMPKNDIVTTTVDNNILNNQALTIDVVIFGYTPRARNEKLKPRSQ